MRELTPRRVDWEEGGGGGGYNRRTCGGDVTVFCVGWKDTFDSVPETGAWLV